jgi:hypothetical protein
VTNSYVPNQIVQDVSAKNLRDQAHPFVTAELFAIGCNNAGAFLPAVLERIQTVVREFGGVWMPVNAEHATIMFGIMLHQSRSIIPLINDQIQRNVDAQL